jgi:hypothetical protein
VATWPAKGFAHKIGTDCSSEVTMSVKNMAGFLKAPLPSQVQYIIYIYIYGTCYF